MGRTICTEPQCLYSRTIPLPPIWAVRILQSLSACTVELYLYSAYGPYGLKEPLCLSSKAIPLLPIWAVRPVQNSYNTTPPMDRTACTEPQCLYSTAIPLLPLWAVLTVLSLSASTLEQYLYFHYGMYGLYRASVPVE